VFDSLGRLDNVEVHASNGQPLTQAEATDYVYDLIGNLDEVVQPNGVLADYQYDALNRLDLLRNYRDANDNGTYEANVDALLVEFDYDVRADGKRTGVTETDGQGDVTRIDWDYDAVGRLIREAYDSHDDSLDFITDYTFDLTGNRVQQKTDTSPTFGGDPTFDKAVDYLYDANDRLISESLDSDNDGTAERTTTYGYDHTQQTNKTVWQGEDTDRSTGTKLSETNNEYNLQGRLLRVETDSNADGTIDATSEYDYDARGIRVSQMVDGVTTSYLFDHHNFTGYAQVLEEKDSAGQIVRSFVLGLDVVSQVEASGEVYYFLYDGHGSTRGLTDANGVIATVNGVVQQFAYDAYGNAIGFAAADSITTLLYSGEWFQIDIGQQYLRARFYDPATGRFNRLDPFAGNMQDPQSLHKYLYGHGDGVNHRDPTGQFSLGGLGVAMSISGQLDVSTLVEGGLLALTFTTIGDVGAKLRQAGLAALAAGNIDGGLELFAIGTRVLSGAFLVAEAASTAIGTMNLGFLGIAIGRALPTIIKKAPGFIANLFRQGRRFGGTVLGYNPSVFPINAGGPIASNEDAIRALLAQHDIPIPDFVGEIRVLEDSVFDALAPNTVGGGAPDGFYGPGGGGGTVVVGGPPVSWKTLTGGSDRITITIRQSVLNSDQRTVYAVVHELVEVSGLYSWLGKGTKSGTEVAKAIVQNAASLGQQNFHTLADEAATGIVNLIRRISGDPPI
jgi:RHS repeat-associated protein